MVKTKHITPLDFIQCYGAFFIMKANELKKQTEVIDNIYKAISEANSNGNFKHFIPHWVYVSDEIILQLINDGFKVYKGEWDGIMKDCLIIEW